MGEKQEKETTEKISLFKLFYSMLYISAFTFGGGFVIVTLMKRKFVDEYHWLTEQEMLDMTALAQSSPGPIAVNAAILVGRKVGGFMGMTSAVLGTIIPPMVILSVISFFYSVFASNRYVALVLKGMQCGVAAVILDVSVGLCINVLKTREWVHYAVMLAAFIATFFLKVNVIFIILAAAVIGILSFYLMKKGGQTGETDKMVEHDKAGKTGIANEHDTTGEGGEAL